MQNTNCTYKEDDTVALHCIECCDENIYNVYSNNPMLIKSHFTGKFLI